MALFFRRYINHIYFFYSDVTASNKELSVYVYDRGNRLSNGEDRFLGTCTIVPSLVSKKTVELVFPLKSRPGDNQEVTGDVRLQVTYTNSQAVSIYSKKCKKKKKRLEV
jgi:protein-serine/threonine kinase